MSYAVSPSMSDDERDIDIESDVRKLFVYQIQQGIRTLLSYVDGDVI